MSTIDESTEFSSESAVSAQELGRLYREAMEREDGSGRRLLLALAQRLRYFADNSDSYDVSHEIAATLLERAANAGPKRCAAALHLATGRRPKTERRVLKIGSAVASLIADGVKPTKAYAAVAKTADLSESRVRGIYGEWTATADHQKFA